MIAGRFTSVLMSALVLICPLLDGGSCQGACPAREVAVDGHHDHDQDPCGHDHHSPCDHRCPHDDDAPDCLCKGAIVAAPTQSPGQHKTRILLIAAVNMESAPQLAAVHAREPAVCHGLHFPPLLSGRQIRALMSSYLL